MEACGGTGDRRMDLIVQSEVDERLQALQARLRHKQDELEKAFAITQRVVIDHRRRLALWKATVVAMLGTNAIAFLIAVVASLRS